MLRARSLAILVASFTLTAAGAGFAQEPAAADALGQAPPTPEEMQKLLEAMKKEQDEFIKAVGLRDGPLTGDMGIAQVQVPEGFVFTDGNGAKKWAELTTNPVSGKEIGLVGPKDNKWLVLFEYDDVGYVKDDEKDKLDADDLLASIKEGTEAFNRERARVGVPPLVILGWEQTPAYNAAAHALEWCVRAESQGEPSLNFNTRLLGRRGVISVTLMFGGEVQLAEVLPEFRAFLAGFSFKEGETYAEYRDGDKLAEYGLAALVAGGGVALAAKSGILAKLGLILAKGGKAVIIGVIAVFGAIASAVKRLFGRRE
jgi:uncharacterized membrane-anchored protein